jgi:spore germination cell wall hydrolase CwlJ-like protein
MRKTTLAAGGALALVLGIQQYQLNRITDEVVQIKTELKFITQAAGPLVSYSEKDEACLARNIYYEAGVESERGKYAVAQVTMNRLKTKRWGDTICKVVYAKSQFSWTLKKKLAKPRGQAWDDSQWVAHRALRGDQVPSLRDAHFYHADYIKPPKWRDPKAQISQIGQHIFYASARMKVDKKAKG